MAACPANSACPDSASPVARLLPLMVSVTLLTVMAGCGSGSPPAPSPHLRESGTPQGSVTSPKVTAPLATSVYCGSEDVPIPGAAAALAGQGPQPLNLTQVEEAWYGMRASMVPACSEITPDPPPVTTKNLSRGQLSDAALQMWVKALEEALTLQEWGQQHGQTAFLQYLGAGTGLVAFVGAGGAVKDSPRCEYPSSVFAVPVSATQMSELTATSATSAGVIYAGVAVGPCSSTWTAADGSVTDQDLTNGQEAGEVVVTTTAKGSATSDYVRFLASYTAGANQTANSIMQQLGIQ